MPLNPFPTQLPIIQAPMAGVQDSKLAAAVCIAGGLGSIPCAMLNPGQVAMEIQSIRAATDAPYNLNFFCHTSPQAEPERLAAWLLLLEPYFHELGIGTEDIPASQSREPFTHSMADAIEPARPPVISFHFGLPPVPLLQRVKDWGSTILASATTLAEAQWLEARGVDGIIAQGIEAGGHRGMFLSQKLTGQCRTFELLSSLVSKLHTPVIAAGGIGDAADVRTALEQGAVAVQVGTAYLLCPETNTSALHRTALVNCGPEDTAITNVFTGRAARGIINRAIRELGPINPAAPTFPLAASAINALRRRAEQLGSADFTPLWCGQKAPACREVPAATLTRTLFADH